MTGSYCLSKVAHVISYHLYYDVCSKVKMSASSTSASRQTMTTLINSIFNNHATQTDLLAVDASFQFVDVQDPGTIDSLLISVK